MREGWRALVDPLLEKLMLSLVFSSIGWIELDGVG